MDRKNKERNGKREIYVEGMRRKNKVRRKRQSERRRKRRQREKDRQKGEGKEERRYSLKG